MKNIRTKRGIVTLAIIAGICVVNLALVSYLSKNFSIQGEKKVDVEVNEQYEDLGAHVAFGPSVKVESSVDTSKIGNYKVTYKWLCFQKNREVRVVDLKAPTIILNGSEEVVVRTGSVYQDAGAIANDNYDLDLTSKIEVKGLDKVDVNVPADYLITYSVKDSSGNETSQNRKVIVIDGDVAYQREVSGTEKLDKEALEVILSWYNRYYQSMKDLELVETKDLFAEKSADYGYMSDMGIKLLIACRLEADHSLKLSNCYYDLDIQNVTKSSNGELTVNVLEHSYLNFAFMPQTQSSVVNLKCTFKLTKVDGEYKLTNIDKMENFLLIFSRDYKKTNDYVTYFDNIYTTYMEKFIAKNNEYESALALLNNGTTSYQQMTTLTAKNEYDRQKAVDYAQTYALTRNKKYWSLVDTNCQNFASQCLFASGIPMDTNGKYQWKYFNTVINTENEAAGRSKSFVSIVDFRDYIKNKDSQGIVAQMDLPMFYGEIGDLIYYQDLRSRYHHVVIVTSVVKDDNGNVIDLLVNGNTSDMANYPVTASCYINRDVVKIVGYN